MSSCFKTAATTDYEFHPKCFHPPMVQICPKWQQFQAGPWSLVTLLSGHLWPYYPRSLATLLSGHLRPYPFNNSHPPCVPPYNCLHSTSLFKLPTPCVPLYHCLHSTSLFKLPPPAFHYTIVSILLLYLNFPPCVPLSHGLHPTSLFKLPPPAFH